MQHRLVAEPGIQVRRVLPAAALASIAWLVLFVFSASGNGAVIRHDRLLQGGPPWWLATTLFVAGWQVMLAAMMVPASLQAFSRVRFGRPAALFGGGYFAVWTLFGLLLFFFDALVHATVKGWPWLASHPWLIAGATVILAGAYQLSDLKGRSLNACRRLNHTRSGSGPASDGFRHGLNCIGASGGLMVLAFAIATGNMVTMSAIALFMVYEVSPWGAGVVKLMGYCLIGLGIVLMAGPVPIPPWLPV